MRGASPVPMRSEPTIAPERVRYLAEIAQTLRGYRAGSLEAGRSRRSRRRCRAHASRIARFRRRSCARNCSGITITQWGKLDPWVRTQLDGWESLRARYGSSEQEYEVRGTHDSRRESDPDPFGYLECSAFRSRTSTDWGDRIRYLALENRPGIISVYGWSVPL